MALTITTTITVADDEAYTAREQAILDAIAAHPAGKGLAAAPAKVEHVSIPTIDITAKTAEAANARIAESKAKAAEEAKAKAAAAAKAKAKADALSAAAAKEVAAAAAAEVEAAEEPAEEAEEDLVGGGEPEVAYTLEEAVAAATKLVSTGQGTKVKEALAGTSAKKVSALTGDDITTFMQALAV